MNAHRTDSTSTCATCGQPIVIRYVAGKRTPIHLHGSSCAGSRGALVSRTDAFSFAPSGCPKCGARVFFIRHNGGSVWLNDLGWPWPLHGCMSQRANVRFAEVVAGGGGWAHDPDALLGHVTFASAGAGTPGTDLLIRASDGFEYQTTVAGDQVGLAGHLVAVSMAHGFIASPALGHAAPSIKHNKRLGRWRR